MVGSMDGMMTGKVAGSMAERWVVEVVGSMAE